MSRTHSGHRQEHGAGELGFLCLAACHLEEMALLKKLAAGLGSKNIDFRLRRRDFSADGKLAGRPWLGLKLAEIKDLDAALVIGSFLRRSSRWLRNACARAKKFTKVSIVSVGGDDQLIRLHQNFTVSPAHLVLVVAAIGQGGRLCQGVPAISGRTASSPAKRLKAIAQSLIEGEKRHIFLGNVAEQHPEAATIHALTQEIARLTGAPSVSLAKRPTASAATLLGAADRQRSQCHEMLVQLRKAYVVLGAELERDATMPARDHRTQSRPRSPSF